MTRLVRPLAPWLAILLLVGLASGQDDAAQFERVEVRAVAVSGVFVTLDAGSSAGLRPGDTVLLFPLGGAAVESVVRAVSKSSSRVELDMPTAGIEIGVRGEALVPADRTAGTGDRPPWRNAETDFDQELPLLAPVEGIEPQDREPRVHGRVYERFQWVRDDVAGSRQYGTSRTGVDFGWENPFGNGGGLQVDVELDQRTSDLPDDDENETRLRVDRLSYFRGGDRSHPTRWEVGRFLQHEFPELGVLDGAELALRTASGSRVGASVGYMPEPNDTFESGKDLQAALFYRYVTDEEETVALGAAYQKTWHEGQADRDLLVGTAEYRPGPMTWIYGAAWFDYYDSNELVKPSGVELTELHVRAHHRFDQRTGGGIFATHLEWPDLRRDELPPTSVDDILDNRLDRVGIDGWRQVSERVRLSARVDRWTDEDDEGMSGELSVSMRDLLYDDGEVGVSVFDTDGKFSSGMGGRVHASRRFGAGNARISYELFQLDQSGFTGDQSSLSHHTLRAGYDTVLGRDWSLSIFGENRFGDEQDSLALGFYLQRRF